MSLTATDEDTVDALNETNIVNHHMKKQYETETNSPWMIENKKYPNTNFLPVRTCDKREDAMKLNILPTTSRQMYELYTLETHKINCMERIRLGSREPGEAELPPDMDPAIAERGFHSKRTRGFYWRFFTRVIIVLTCCCCYIWCFWFIFRHEEHANMRKKSTAGYARADGNDGYRERIEEARTQKHHPVSDVPPHIEDPCEDHPDGEQESYEGAPEVAVRRGDGKYVRPEESDRCDQDGRPTDNQYVARGCNKSDAVHVIPAARRRDTISGRRMKVAEVRATTSEHQGPQDPLSNYLAEDDPDAEKYDAQIDEETENVEEMEVEMEVQQRKEGEILTIEDEEKEGWFV